MCMHAKLTRGDHKQVAFNRAWGSSRGKPDAWRCPQDMRINCDCGYAKTHVQDYVCRLVTDPG